jgi:hypothetical protein
MVTRESATDFMPEEEAHQIAIAADHSRIVKFTGRSDHNYLQVRSKLRDVIKKTPEILRRRQAHSMFFDK